ncbi:MAG: MFS transporter [Pseudomonadota bacterium]
MADAPDATATPRPPAATTNIWLSGATMWAVTAIGITQIIAWGTSFYALGVLAEPMMRDLGWSKTLVFSGFTVSVLASSVVSIPVGRALDAYGARLVITAGFAALAASLYLLSWVDEIWQYFVVWPIIGIAMRLTLYDAAFAAMVQVDPANGRRAIAYLTLWGGFASTVGWPVGHWLADAVGWRSTFQWYAIANLAICAPLAWTSLKAHFLPSTPAPETAKPSEATSDSQPSAPAPLTGSARRIAMILFSLVMSVNAYLFSVGAVHLVGILEATGLAAGVAVGIAALKGVAQVTGRLWELVFGRHVAPINLGRIATVLVPVSLSILLALGGSYEAALAFVLVFGLSNGIITVVRGAVPLALFGPDGYGRILGILATPVLLCNAVSPVVFAWLVDTFGMQAATWSLMATALVGLAMMELLAAWYRSVQATAG